RPTARARQDVLDRAGRLLTLVIQIGRDGQHHCPERTGIMVPKAVQDAGYTAVGLGVLALQQVQTRRRLLARKVTTELGTATRHAQTVLAEARTRAAPVT